ncbi:hypothetical protein LEP1GSC103_3891 [Leptospira borgpetersenii serovar Javanica str. UI 09931]|uniref:Uncharacterized protein n=3 Tax=Leptospira borgpetersenii TaxID=174 RepID=A0A0S2IMY8_LEPBO|nr:hypothetical protein LBBP_00709 [Leptospira borgpetersenii serovar Ballum]AXX15499.1 hypothetical protein C4Q31_08045 [Leptospira borgpetersenii serovar Ceylonica]EKQ91301.1 hypothetical protein LEP1GSC101_1590 [Leptospira borgpetersenii str. UI 09149]EKR02067.1 hypothetical protein LEP1GSC121_0985 [Leptospira borgpetersenii serovar Castellonis str. 200801910]EMN56400.1 hypothetical protein LEP1GSC090_1885 [Leptospira borgpetersenii serovar Javanica str. MK146]EPG59693.1 hypothetical protei
MNSFPLSKRFRENMRIFRIYVILLLTFLSVWTTHAEQVVTTKKDEPDSYYGLDVKAVISPSYGARIRDGASGISNSNPNDRTGFSTPWTLLMISKTFEEVRIQTELWGELIRNNQLTSDTRVDTGTKQNPYVLNVRRANIKKIWNTSSWGNYTLGFGIQELPHTYTQWSNYWRWRYIDRGPLESLGFASQPADIGLNAVGNWSIISSQFMVSNGEGYRETQNTNSAGMDVSSRFSVEPQLGESGKAGFHLFYRRENAFGSGGNECFEGKTTCLPNDLNPITALSKQIKSLQSDTTGLETNLIWNGPIKWNLGLGGFFKKQNSGEIRDRLQPFAAPVAFGKDGFGKALYAWLSIGAGNFHLLGRIERGTGNNGVVGVTDTIQREFFPGLSTSNVNLPAQVRNILPETRTNGYSSKSSFRRISVFFEWVVNPRFRMAIGYIENKNYDTNGVGQKVYIDQLGNERTEKEYLGQWNGSSNLGIVSYSSLDRQVLLRTTIEF